jgi:hypothetical protein
MQPLQFNHKTLGAPNNIGWDGKAQRRVTETSESGATYSWLEDVDDTPGSVPSTGPGWNDGPALEVAKAAGRRALAEGYGPTSRADGKVACGHCTPCAYNRPDRCHQPMEKAIARQAAGQAQADHIAQAEADADAMARVIWAEQARRGVAL